MIIPELLVPAGSPEKLEFALQYGADAVYAGLKEFGLRAQAGNFTLDELARARELTLKKGRRIYLTLNAFLRPGDTEGFAALLESLRSLDLDAYIVSDPGALAIVKQIDPQREIHLSTQANTSNGAAVQFWGGAGVKRVNLARELTLEEIQAVRAETDLELEVFVHGAMCVAWSGRCLLSAALNGRSANRGACTQPCRWSYALMEETRPGEYFPLEQDERGSYLLNSRDLCLIDHLSDLARAGVDSLKIEGRMKTLYYVAAVTRIYRAALDRLAENPENYTPDPLWREELEKVSHRPYDRGFLFGGRDPLIYRDDSKYLRSSDFLGALREGGPEGWMQVEVRNRFLPGEELSVIGPEMRQTSFRVEEIRGAGGRPLEAAQPNSTVLIQVPSQVRPGDLLRRET